MIPIIPVALVIPGLYLFALLIVPVIWRPTELPYALSYKRIQDDYRQAGVRVYAINFKDDGDPVERSISMVNICNGPAEGGGFPVAPHALMDDGLLSYTFEGKCWFKFSLSSPQLCTF